VSLLSLPIVVALLVLLYTIYDGLASFPARPGTPPFLHSHENPLNFVPKVLSTPGSHSFRTFFWNPLKKMPLSPWHDLPLHGNKNEYKFIVEIPRGTGEKNEIQTHAFLNPIVQDKHKGGERRHVHEPYPFSYGAFPQTWEDPSVLDPWLNLPGDKDPLDVVELGSRVYSVGDIATVKVLGVLALLGNGSETDWKILTIDVNDPLAPTWNDNYDIPRNIIIDIVEFFTFYKVPDGELPSQFAYDGKVLNKTFAHTIIEDKYQKWKSLVHRVDPIIEGHLFSTKCTVCPEPTNPKNLVEEEEAQTWVDLQINLFLEGKDTCTQK